MLDAVDKAHNVLYSSDQLGCNRRSVADSLTLVNNDVRVLLSSLRIFRDKVTALEEAGEIDLDKLVVWSGHDDYEIGDLPGHLDTLITAAQNIVDYGPKNYAYFGTQYRRLGRRFFRGRPLCKRRQRTLHLHERQQ